MTPWQRVGILWALVAGVYAIFNAAFWPVWVYQQRLAPANFEAHARELAAAGDRDAARERLAAGIAQYRPPFAGPYSLLHELAPEEARFGELASFYRGIATRDLAQLSAAIQAQVLRQPAPPREPETEVAIAAMAERMGTALGIAGTVATWSAAEQLALLRLSGGADGNITGTRQIGTTGVVAPADVLVLSGGGDGLRRAAVLYAGGREFVGKVRGLYVGLIDPATGDVPGWYSFDLWEDPQEAQRLREFLEPVPEGTIAAFAVFDDASAYLNAALEGHLAEFGFAREARIEAHHGYYGLRYSFAGLGVKGAAPGSALQAWSPGQFGGATGHPVVCGAIALEEAPAS